MIKICFDIIGQHDICVIAGASKEAQGADRRDKHGGSKQFFWQFFSSNCFVLNCFTLYLDYIAKLSLPASKG